jgi:uncharacterized membrane protein
VVPWSGKERGIASPVWSFKVKLLEIPTFKLDLKLEPNEITLLPGHSKIINAYVTNLGNSNDIIKLSINTTSEINVSFEIYQDDSVKLISGAVVVFPILVTVGDDVEVGKYQDALKITAISTGAEQYSLVVQDEEL